MLALHQPAPHICRSFACHTRLLLAVHCSNCKSASCSLHALKLHWLLLVLLLHC
jgi:hypothetical protein